MANSEDIRIVVEGNNLTICSEASDNIVVSVDDYITFWAELLGKPSDSTALTNYINSLADGKISTHDLSETAHAFIQQKITDETTARQTADTTLQASITAETSTRIAADTILQTNITNEATARANADELITSNLNAEITNREVADTELQADITAEASTRAGADANLQASINTKQDKLTAGSNIQISNNTISATDTTYTAGTGISIVNNVISNTGANASWGNITGTLSNQTDLKNALDGKQPAGDYATNTALTQGLATKQDKLTAGNNITISNNTISATDTTYTAGTGINITNNVISATASSPAWGNITGTLSNQTDLQNALNNKQAVISDLDTIRSNATAGKSASETISGYGNIVTHNTSEFATSAQGELANTALQPNDNITELNNNAGYITNSALTGYATETYVNNHHDSTKQDTLTAGSNITISNNTISATVPTVNNSTITFTQGGTTKGSFTLNQNNNATIALDAGGGGSVTTDNKTINTNSSSELQAIGLINQNDTTKGMKEWVGTYADYVGLSTKDADTMYFTIEDLADLINQFYGYPIQTAYSLAGDAINWKMYGNSQQGLPAGYTQLEYIESSGTQYIDTGIEANAEVLTAGLVLEENCTFLPDGRVAMADGKNQVSYFFVGRDANNKFYSGLGGNYLSSSITNDGEFHTLKLDSSTKIFSIDDVNATTYTGTYSDTRVSNIYLFRVSSGSTVFPITGKKKWVKIWSNGELVRNLIPAKNSSNELGMYDLVTGTFYTNAGTGVFTAGSEMPSPSAPLEVQGVGTAGANVYHTTLPVKVNGTLQQTVVLTSPLYKIGNYADYIDYENQRIVRKVGVVTLSEGTHTIASAVANSPYLCTQQSAGTLSGQSITLDTGVTNAQVYYQLATETYESITVPNLTLARGTNVITADTALAPADGYIQCKVSEI